VDKNNNDDALCSNNKQNENYFIEEKTPEILKSDLNTAYEFADVYKGLYILFDPVKIKETDIKNPQSFLAFCTAVCFGKINSQKKNIKEIEILKMLANNRRN
jgi:hypothetical protein